MTGSTSEHHKPEAFAPKTQRLPYAALGTVCALVIGLYVSNAKSGWMELWSLNAQNTYYNLMVQGFRSGHLSLNREVPPGLAHLADPYDPKNISPYLGDQYLLLDQSYYKGKLYLYFGVAPALLLSWPYEALTGHYLLHRDAVVIFFSVGFLAGVGLLWAVWRSYFAEVGVWVVGATALALGCASLTPAILQRCDVYEVAIGCGYALTMAALLLLWWSMHAARGRAWWLAGAGLAYGLAVGARPSLLFGAVILLVPVAWACRGGGLSGPRLQLGVLVIAAIGPILAIGLGLMLYNFLRFDNPFEFGWRYQLCWDRQDTAQVFSLRYLGFNSRVYFLEPAHWSGRFPFVHDITVPPLPAGHARFEQGFGVLTNIPVVGLVLALPFICRSRRGGVGPALCTFCLMLALLFGIEVLTLGFFRAACLRYEVEFLAVLLLLVSMGILGLEWGLAGRRAWRLATRWVWGSALALSVAFNLFAMCGRSVEYCLRLGKLYMSQGQLAEARNCYQKALRLEPNCEEACFGIGMVRFHQGRMAEAQAHLEQALRLQPNSAETHNNLGMALFRQGRMAEAIQHLEEGLRLQPHRAETQNNLGFALFKQGKVPQAIAHLEEALRLEPEFAEAHYNLANALLQQGKVAEAIGHLEKLLLLRPGVAEAHYNLANALLQQGKVAEAIRHLEEAVRLKPAFVEAHDRLARLLATCADGALRNATRAIEHAEEANRLSGGNDPAILDTLAAAYAEAGRYAEAERTAQAAFALTQAAGPPEAARQIEARLHLYQAGQPYREGPAPERK